MVGKEMLDYMLLGLQGEGSLVPPSMLSKSLKTLPIFGNKRLSQRNIVPLLVIDVAFLSSEINSQVTYKRASSVVSFS